MDNTEKMMLIELFKNAYGIFRERKELNYKVEGTNYKLVLFRSNNTIHYYITKLVNDLEMRLSPENWLPILIKIKEAIKEEIFNEEIDYEAGM